MGTFGRIKLQGREVEHSFEFGAEVKNEWSCNCTEM
jgi:hypothetical protein